MKHKLSVSLDKDLAHKLADALSTDKFRNKSHLIELAVKKLLEEETLPRNFRLPSNPRRPIRKQNPGRQGDAPSGDVDPSKNTSKPEPTVTRAKRDFLVKSLEEDNGR